MLVFEETFICVRFWINSHRSILEIHYTIELYAPCSDELYGEALKRDLKALLRQLSDSLPAAPGPLPIDLKNGDAILPMENGERILLSGSEGTVAGKIRTLIDVL